MALDMEQLRKIFYEECRENLEVLERELLALDPDAKVDLEMINTIFRAAHSIKGGSATFDLNQISQFTHVMETLLDQAREGKRHLDLDTIDLLLKGGDCINGMLVSYETNCDFDEDLKNQLTDKFNQLLNNEDILNQDVALLIDPIEPNLQNDWFLSFKPHKEIFFTGNDPLRILKELSDLDANCIITCLSDELVSLAELEPEMCYLHWNIQLDGQIERTSIEEIFEWVEDDCELDISRLNNRQLEKDEILKNEINQDQIPSLPQIIDNDKPSISTSAVEFANEMPTEKKSPSSKNNSKSEVLSSIRVEIDKVDDLINLVGELVITQSMLTELSQNFSENKLEKLQNGLDLLLQNTKELQESVLNIRMLPISFAFNRFPRLIRDLSTKLGKLVELSIDGEQTELDKTVLERITDPLVHLVRNAIDHGLEQPEERRVKGKPEIGHIFLNAYHQGGSIIIEVRDDGAGLNKEKVRNKAIEKGLLRSDILIDDLSSQQIHNLIFSPGFSTADKVSDVSGRGVGMDVVKRNIEDLGGQIDVSSKEHIGSTFKISLPLTLAILDGQLVKLGGQVFIVPLISIIESIVIEPERIKVACGGVELYRLRDENIPILRLKEEFALGESKKVEKPLLCFVEAGENKVGLLLDEMLGQQQVVIKSLESNYTRVDGISGATILGDGSVSLILDIQGLINRFLKRVKDPNNYIAA